MKGGVEGGFGDFVVVVEELAGFGEGVGVVGSGSELVGVLEEVLVLVLLKENGRIKLTQAKSTSSVGTTVFLGFSPARRTKRWYLTMRRCTVDITPGLCSQSSLVIFCMKVPCRRIAPTRSMPKTLELSQ